MPCVQDTCKLSSGSWDGFGHQLDAKLSCIAVAAHLGIEYIHVPFRGHAHGTRSQMEALESMLGFNESFRQSDPGLRIQPRQRAAPSWWPAPYGRSGACSGKPYQLGWLRQMELLHNNASWAPCCKDVLYHNDNCWDYFHCHPDWPGIWETVAPTIKSIYSSRPKPGKICVVHNDARPELCRPTHYCLLLPFL
jgi:hypothetical protein